jgi:hypothetical protein
VLIELDLMESPWAYSVMAVTILIDAYLLYIFFTVQKTASNESRTLWAPLTLRDRSDPHDRIPSDMTELPHDPFGRLNRLLGYVIAIVAIAMLVNAIRPQL